MPILGIVIGETFERLLAAAQGGTGDPDGAFSVLWRDANPALLRYLRVIAPEAAEDIAADTWVQVVRGLDAFRGDEAAWRAWLFTTARRRAIDEHRPFCWRHPEPFPLTTRRLLSPRRVPCGGPGPTPPGDSVRRRPHGRRIVPGTLSGGNRPQWYSPR